jgi:hypothetical protein
LHATSRAEAAFGLRQQRLSGHTLDRAFLDGLDLDAILGQSASISAGALSQRESW